jgi:shikimate kinase
MQVQESAPPRHENATAIVEMALRVRAALGRRSIVLVGMMGAGKSSVGRKLAKSLCLPFNDTDTEIEKAAGMSVAEIFATQGEAVFRSGESRVLARLLESGPGVLATGGGAWMSAATRERVAEAGISVWLRADADLLLRRVRRRNDRPLLRTADPGATLRALLAEREPAYATAAVIVESRDVPHEDMVAATLGALDAHLSGASQERRA